MSRSAPAGAGGALARARACWRILVAAGLVGAAAGAFWGIADNPTYRATSEVVLAAPVPALETDSLPDPPDASTVLALAGSEEVARAAAGRAGDDLSGADLLSIVTARAGVDPGTIEFVADSHAPDFAAAAADAFGAALVDVVSADWRRRLEAAIEVSEGTPRGAEVRAALALGPPLSVAGAAALPTKPRVDRSAGLLALIGFGLGGFVGIAAVGLGGGRRQVPVAAVADQAERPAAPAPAVAPTPKPAARPRRPARRLSPSGPEPAIRVLFASDSFTRALDGPVRATPDDLEQARDLAEALGLSGRAGSICVSSALRGEGRSTIATALAVACALAGTRTLLVEADLRHPVLERRLDLVPEPGLVDYLSGVTGPAEVSRSLDVADPAGASRRLVCVPAGGAGEAAAEWLGSDRIRGLAERLERVYETVIFDSPAALSYPDGARIAAATGRTVVCTRPQANAGLPRRRVAEILGVEPAAFVEVTR